jgi:hypothetical protein
MRDAAVSPTARGLRGVVYMAVAIGALTGCRDKLMPPPGPAELDGSASASTADGPLAPDRPAASSDGGSPPTTDGRAPDGPASSADTRVDGSRPPDGSVTPPDGPRPPDAPPPTPPDAMPPQSTCGAPNGPCCEDLSCQAGGCCGITVGGQPRCVPPGDACRLPGGNPGGTCSNGVCSGCGGVLNQLCCQGDTCTGPGLVCEDETCEACGGPGGPCCPGNVCNGNQQCEDDECVPCGGPDQPCCANRVCNNGGCCLGEGVGECVGAGDICIQPGPNGGTCMAGKCSQCGNAGQDCCTGDVCYDAGRACLNGNCLPCGGPNQPACKGRVCNADLCVDDDGTCLPQGAFCGQQSGRCMPGGSCMNGNIACGGINLPCCGATSPPLGVFCSHPSTICLGLGAARRCVQCGEMGQPCCEDDVCRAGACGGLLGNRTCR